MYHYSVTALATLIVIIKLCRPSKLDPIPTVGSSSWLGSWWAGIKFLANGLDIIQQGYEKHKGAPFKIAELHRWTIILSSRAHVEELRKVPDDILSFNEGADAQLLTRYTMGPEVYHSPYHVLLIRSKLTQNIATMYPEMKEELVLAFDDFLDLRGNEWKSVPAFSTVRKLVSRTSNRLLVGLPLCRNLEWIDLTIQNTLGVVKAAAIITLFPDALKPLAARFLTGINQSNARARELLRPTIEERQRYLDACGDEWADKPDDFLSWLMDLKVEGMEMSVEILTAYILAANFASIHATSTSFTHMLFYLAAHPQYIQPLRDEVEDIVKKEGWSKSAVGKMRKVDSFIKEVQRLEGTGGGMIRKALKDYTFSDGMFVPKGTMIIVASRPVHYDEAIYPDAHVFMPFRFSEMREDPGEGVKHHFVSTTPEYLPFGHGRHACPGRFLAATELKSMLAHIVMMYDIKLEGATRPEPLRIGAGVVPSPTAGIMFRKRVDKS